MGRVSVLYAPPSLPRALCIQEADDVHLSRKWRDDRWLAENVATGLTEGNVLDYFALSEWYDKSCLTGMFHMHVGPNADRYCMRDIFMCIYQYVCVYICM